MYIYLFKFLLNNTTMTLNKIELVHPIFQMIFIGFSVSNIYEFKLFDSNFFELLHLISLLIFTYIIYQILNISKRVELRKNELTEGFYINPIGFIKVNNQISINEIIEININQNSKKYFDIFAKAKNGKIVIIKTIANKFPAKRELEIIKNEINSYQRKGLIQNK